MHKKRIKDKDYFYTTIRESSKKTRTIYLGSTKKQALKKEKSLKKPLTFLIFLIALTSLIYASEFTTITQENFNQGTYGATEYNSSGFVQLARNDSFKELPANGTYDGHINMSGNILLLHLNNDSNHGENDDYIYDFSGYNNSGAWGGDAIPDADSGPTTNGKLNGAFMFDKTDDAIEGSISGGG